MAEQVRKAIFLGTRVIHSNKKNQDFRVVALYTPPFKASNGLTYGGVQEYFVSPDSSIGAGISVGAIVRPAFVTNPYSRNVDLSDVTKVSESPYSPQDFEG